MHRLRSAGGKMIAGVALAMLAGAAPLVSAARQAAPADRAPPPATTATEAPPVEPARVVAVYPHDSGAFTQGLFFDRGRLFESTGRRGQSGVREVDLKTGKIRREVRLPSRYFGEGSTAWRNTVISLTWTHGTGFVWNRDDFAPKRQFSYAGEGWGLTQDGESLILSDGTPTLRFLDPDSFAERRRITVTWRGRPVRQINELEYVRGEVLANIWQTALIARIDPASGAVRGFIDLTAIASQIPARDPDAVPNGIAYDAGTGKLYVTGKLWPSLYEIALPAMR